MLCPTPHQLHKFFCHTGKRPCLVPHQHIGCRHRRLCQLPDTDLPCGIEFSCRCRKNCNSDSLSGQLIGIQHMGDPTAHDRLFPGIPKPAVDLLQTGFPLRNDQLIGQQLLQPHRRTVCTGQRMMCRDHCYPRFLIDGNGFHALCIVRLCNNREVT